MRLIGYLKRNIFRCYDSSSVSCLALHCSQGGPPFVFVFVLSSTLSDDSLVALLTDIFPHLFCYFFSQ